MQSYCTSSTSIPEEYNFAFFYKGVQKKTHQQCCHILPVILEKSGQCNFLND